MGVCKSKETAVDENALKSAKGVSFSSFENSVNPTIGRKKLRWKNSEESLRLQGVAE